MIQWTVIIMNKINGSKVVSKGVDISVSVNNEVVTSIAKKLAITITLSNDSISKLLSTDDLEQCFVYALSVVLEQDQGGRASRELVPTFLSDITLPLTSKYRGIILRANGIEVGMRPHSYDTFLDVLQSLGIPVGKVLRVNPEAVGNVLLIGESDLGGNCMLVGVESDASIEELVVRAMVSVSEEEQCKLFRIVGHMDNMYIGRDELVRQWASSLPVTKR